MTGTCADRDLALAFATAISQPFQPALMIDRDNRKAGELPVGQAARSGCAFAVRPREGIAALDVDGTTDHGWAQTAWAWAREVGIATVLAESGRPGHWTLWLIGPVGWDHRVLSDAVRGQLVENGSVPAAAARLDGLYTRPPYAPHRYLEGAASTVLAPTHPHLALRMFRRHPGMIPLSDVQRRKLRDPLPSDRHTRLGTVSRRALAQSIATAYVRADRTLSELQAAFANPGNRGGEWYRAKDTRARGADRLLRELWKEQLAYVRETPEQSADGLLRQHLIDALTSADGIDWKGPQEEPDRHVLSALLRRGVLAAANPVSVSLRDLALESGISRNGVIASLRRLNARGLVQAAATTEHGQATSYLIALAEVGPYREGTNRGPFYTGGQDYYLVRATWVWRDLFSDSPGGLGVSRRTTYECMPTDQFVSTRQVQDLRPVRTRRRALEDQLNCLERHGLAERRSKAWRAIEPTVDQTKQLARELGVLGVGRRRAMTYERERSKFAMSGIGAVGEHTPTTTSIEPPERAVSL